MKKEELNDKNVTQLRAIAKDLKITGYSKKDKETLITEILNLQKGDETPIPQDGVDTKSVNNPPMSPEKVEEAIKEQPEPNIDPMMDTHIGKPCWNVIHMFKDNKGTGVTMAMQVGQGIIVRTINEHKTPDDIVLCCSESSTFVPNMRIEQRKAKDGSGAKLVPITDDKGFPIT